MRWHGRRVAVYAYAVPADMRNGFDGLCALVTQGLHRNPLSGDVFVFVSRNRVRAKILQWDGTGLCVYAKRLEKGRFMWPPIIDGAMTLTPAQLAVLIEAMDWRRTVAPPAPIRPVLV